MTYTHSRLILLIGVILILISSFGIQFGPADLFKLGVGVSFAAALAA